MFFDKVGNLGLRHKRAVSKAEPGGVYLLLKRGEVKPPDEQNSLLTRFAQKVNAEPTPSISNRARVHQRTSHRPSASPPPPTHRPRASPPPTHRARMIQTSKSRVVRTRKRKRTMDVTDTAKWVQMKKSANATELSSKLRSTAHMSMVSKPSSPITAADFASSEEETTMPAATTHSILSEKITEVLCKYRHNLNLLTPKKVRREVEALLGYEKGGLDPKKAWMKTKLEEIHKKLLAGDL